MRIVTTDLDASPGSDSLGDRARLPGPARSILPVGSRLPKLSIRNRVMLSSGQK